MKGVIAFDVSKGHSYMVVYDALRNCVFEGNFTHDRTFFEDVRTRIEAQKNQDGIMPDIVFEATGVYSKPLERLMQSCRFEYAPLKTLEAKMQSLACGCTKWIGVMHINSPRLVLRIHPEIKRFRIATMKKCAAFPVIIPSCNRRLSGSEPGYMCWFR